MRILTFNYEYPPIGGGGGVAHELIATELAARHRVVVITSAFGTLPVREQRDGVEIVRVRVAGRRDTAVASLPSMLTYPGAAARAARALMRDERFDVVHAHFAVPTGVGSLRAAKKAGVPHVISLHGGDIYDPSKRLSPHRLPLVRTVVSRVMQQSDAVVAQSQNTRENAYRYYTYRGPIEVIPLGIRPPQFNPASREVLGLSPDRFIAVTVGRLVTRKRVDRLLRALARPECSAVDLVVVGDGPERAGLEDIAKALGVAQRVQFAGHVAEERKWQLMAACDAFVTATEHEGFGLVYVEAMTVGLPVVTFDHGGQADFLRDGEHGYLVPAGNIEELAAAIARLQRDPARVAAFREHNRAAATQHHVRHCAAEYEKLFEKLIASPR